MDQKIKDFWEGRSVREDFLWHDLAAMNAELTAKHLRPGMQVLDLGCGDGRSTERFSDVELTLVDYVRPAGLVIPPNAVFVQEDIRKYKPDRKFDLITLYGVANSFNAEDNAQIYHMCYGWLKSGGKLIVKHQCGKRSDVVIDGHSDVLGGHYCAYYHSVKKHARLLRLAGFDVLVGNPYPLEWNKWKDTVFKYFICQRQEAKPHTAFFSPERVKDESQWEAMHRERDGLEVFDSAKKWKLLETVKEQFDAADVPFYLVFGTLLGAVRGGDFIEWDGDVDIAVLARFHKRLHKILDKMKNVKLVRMGDWFCSLAYGSEFMDVYTYTEDGEKYSYCGGWNSRFDEEKEVFDRPSKITFYGKEFLTVNSPETSLTNWYGEDWAVPKKNFWGH